MKRQTNAIKATKHLADTSQVKPTSLRVRLGLGVAVAALLLSIIGFFVLSKAEDRFVAEVSDQLATTADLEVSRVEQRLAFQGDVVAGLALGSRIQMVVDRLAQGEESAGADLVTALHVFVVGSPQFQDATVVGPSGVVASTSANPNIDVAEHAVINGEVLYGEPYAVAGSGRLPIAAALNTPADLYAYTLVVDYDLSDVQSLVAGYEDVGDTWESHIAWRNDSGDAAFLTRLRFDSDAAFARIVPGDRVAAPIVQAVNGVEDVLVGVPDYRQVPSILAIRTVDPVGWGLVVKADYEEAVRAFGSIRVLWLVVIASATAMMVGVLWFAFDRLGRRLARFSKAAEAVRNGDFSRRINDPHPDELGRVAAEFDRATDTLAAAIEEKARFVATVSHELRTPLSAVIGLADLLDSKSDHLSESERRQAAREIAIQSNELGSLVEDLLVVASSRNGSLFVEAVEVLVCDLIDSLTSQLPEEVTSKLEIDAKPVLSALADWKRTKQILRNLIINAHKYGGDRIRVVGRVDDDRVVVTVLDNGSGVESVLAERIFVAFERGRHESTESVGLGLNIARELAHRMNGDLVYERQGGWTAFVLTLPRAEIRRPVPIAR